MPGWHLAGIQLESWCKIPIPKLGTCWGAAAVRCWDECGPPGGTMSSAAASREGCCHSTYLCALCARLAFRGCVGSPEGCLLPLLLFAARGRKVPGVPSVPLPL